MESIEPLLERVLAGSALSAPERSALLASRDLLALGMAADEMRRRVHGDRVTFVRVAMIPVDRAADARWEGSPGEVRLTGRPADLDQAVAAVRALRGRAGDVPVTGFSLADVAAAAGGAASLGAWCDALRAAGLSSIAHAEVDRLESADIVRVASEAGLPLGALTVDRRPVDVTELIDRAAQTLAACPSVSVFAPLPRRVGGESPTTGYEDVHLVAAARLLLPVRHIQVDWQRYGPKLAQVALTFGADDVDAVLPADEVAEGRRRSPLEEIRRNIRAASAEPVERGPVHLAR